MRNFSLKLLLVLLLVSVAGWAIWARFEYPRAGIDDANIFFVYAQNVANGHGFVYNVGGERVEGFSSLLWTLICSAVFRVFDQPEVVLLLINVILISFGITAAISYIQRLFSRGQYSYLNAVFASSLFLALLLTSPMYLAWNLVSLMENPLWSTLVLLAALFVIRDELSGKLIYGIFLPLSVLLLLTRPEAYAWVAVLTGILYVRRALDFGWKHAVREFIPLLTTILLAIAGLTLFRIVYFGYPLPNTYYAKVSPSFLYNMFQGTKYAVQYFVSNPIVSIAIAAAALNAVNTVLLLMEGKITNDGPLFLPVLAGTGLLLPMVTGGDHFSSFRFYQAVYPILLLCLVHSLWFVLPQYIQIGLTSSVLRRSQAIFAFSLIVLFAAGLVLYQVRDWVASEELSEMSDEFEFAEDGRETGQFVGELFAAEPSLPAIGVIRAGGIKYPYPGQIIDLMGLNNLTMAHNGGERKGEKNHAAFEKATFFQLHPDLINPEIVPVEDRIAKVAELKTSWENTVPLKGLYNEPDFLNVYVYASVQRADLQANKALVGWFEKKYLSQLDASGDFVIERYAYPGE
jgi:arabinofuranosyltransferase